MNVSQCDHPPPYVFRAHAGIHVVVMVGMDSHHDVDNEDEEEEDDDEEGSEGGSVNGEGTQGPSQASAQEGSQEGEEQGEGGQEGAVAARVPRTPDHYHLGKTEVFQVQEGQEGYDDAQPLQQAMVRVAGPSLSCPCSQLCFHVDKFCLGFHLSALSCAELPRTCQLISFFLCPHTVVSIRPRRTARGSSAPGRSGRCTGLSTRTATRSSASSSRYASYVLNRGEAECRQEYEPSHTPFSWTPCLPCI